MAKSTLAGLIAVVIAAAGTASPLVAQNCSNSPTGLTPLPTLGTGTYHGKTGGLYPSGSNSIPSAHLTAGNNEASLITPLDSAGNPSCDGRIGVIAIGMSVARQTFDVAFRELHSDLDQGRNPAVVLIDGTTGGTYVNHWAAGIGPSPGFTDLWQKALDQLPGKGLTNLQVQAAFVMMIGNEATQTFPTNMQTYRDQMITILQELRTRFPNCRIAHLTTHPCLAWSAETDPIKQEPTAYENGFGVKWTIEEQIRGNPALKFTSPGAVAPWIAWAPYVWADGTTTSGAKWECSDFVDSVHLSSQGQAKIGLDMDAFYNSASTATPWYQAPTLGCVAKKVALETGFGASCAGTNGDTPFIQTSYCPPPCTGGVPLIANSIPFLGNSQFRLHASHALANRTALLLLTANQTLPVPSSCGVLVDVPSLTALYTTTTASNGVAGQLVAIPNLTALQDLVVFCQWFIDDPNGALPNGTSNYSATRAIRLRLGQP